VTYSAFPNLCRSRSLSAQERVDRQKSDASDNGDDKQGYELVVYVVAACVDAPNPGRDFSHEEQAAPAEKPET